MIIRLSLRTKTLNTFLTQRNQDLYPLKELKILLKNILLDLEKIIKKYGFQEFILEIKILGKVTLFLKLKSQIQSIKNLLMIMDIKNQGIGIFQ